jgi:hypothetical protein
LSTTASTVIAAVSNTGAESKNSRTRVATPMSSAIRSVACRSCSVPGSPVPG